MLAYPYIISAEADTGNSCFYLISVRIRHYYRHLEKTVIHLTDETGA